MNRVAALKLNQYNQNRISNIKSGVMTIGHKRGKNSRPPAPICRSLDVRKSFSLGISLDISLALPPEKDTALRKLCPSKILLQNLRT